MVAVWKITGGIVFPHASSLNEVRIVGESVGVCPIDLSFVEFMSKGHDFFLEQGVSIRQEVSIPVEGAGRCSLSR